MYYEKTIKISIIVIVLAICLNCLSFYGCKHVEYEQEEAIFKNVSIITLTGKIVEFGPVTDIPYSSIYTWYQYVLFDVTCINISKKQKELMNIKRVKLWFAAVPDSPFTKEVLRPGTTCIIKVSNRNFGYIGAVFNEFNVLGIETIILQEKQ